MLVLSRQRDESIVIGDSVVVTVVDIRGDKVRLGIEAPGEIPVHRREVYEAIQRENRNGGAANPNSPKHFLPRFYDTMTLPGENFNNQYLNSQQILYR
jgi:carbon storage regulator